MEQVKNYSEVGLTCYLHYHRQTKSKKSLWTWC